MLKRSFLAILLTSSLFGTDLRFLKKGDKGEILTVDLDSIRVRRGLMFFELVSKDNTGFNLFIVAYDPSVHKAKVLGFRWYKNNGESVKDDTEGPWQAVESDSAIDLAINLVIEKTTE